GPGADGGGPGADGGGPGADGDTIEALLAEVFGHDGFRTGQRAAIEAFLEGRDVEVVLPTGGGKSLCFQLPAIALARGGAGPTLVVSPLVALMEDQVAALARQGVSAVALHRGIPTPERRQILRTLASQVLIYASPERLAGEGFRRKLARVGVSRVVVDEAHCISEWGHDFRPEYLKLGILKEELGVPTMALTATATRRVMAQVRGALGLVEPLSVWGSFERSNLALSVEHHRGDKVRVERLVALLSEAGLGRDPAAGRVVVYASTRKRVRAVSTALRRAKIKSGYYHAGRTDAARARAQEAFEAGKHAVLVATTAFGMGVDLPDVRMVIHVQAPGTLEGYYQQAGRAGRDGLPARCVLLYSPGDARTQATLQGDSPHPGSVEGFRALQDYIYGTTCRQAALISHFTGASTEPCGRCDVCRDPGSIRAAVERARAGLARARDRRRAKLRAEGAVVLDDAQREIVVAFVRGLRRPVGRAVLAGGLRGSRARRIKRARLEDNPHFGALSGVPESAIVRAVDELLAAGRLAPRGRKYPTVWIPDKRVRPARPPGTAPGRPRATGLSAALRAFRRREARRRRWKPYQVFTDQLLESIVEQRPATPEALLALRGMGARRMERFGEEILELVAAHPA
ncbi:MAG TPA: ATP-dependent DNA helicase RecQ, partial [Deltaproteobacteria bacterium]|nr:ATP-dependent DNA helicase RecQ [Deltaproteobacteria bacterium]